MFTSRAVTRLILSLTFASATLAAARAQAAAPEEALARLQAAVPRQTAQFGGLSLAPISKAAGDLEQSAANVARFEQSRQPELVLTGVERLLALKKSVDELLDETLALRVEFVQLEPADAQRAAICNFLAATSQLIDLSGRLRYLLFDALNAAAADVAVYPAARDKLLDLLIKHRSSIGAVVMSDLLFDPPAESDTADQPVSAAARSKVLQLIALAGQNELLPQLAQFVNGRPTAPWLVVQAAETIRQVGLPQDPRPKQDPTLPAAAITARQLRAIVQRVNPASLSPVWQPRREAILTWLEGRVAKGLVRDTYQLGPDEIHPGDWLLMRNPSPYNLFTDLSPGLFTHVGVVAMEDGGDGIRRMVLVDLPEQGDRMPATNIDTFVQRTRHYVFLRHPDSEAARKMGEAAGALIGNETQFDLNFRTDRVLDLAGQDLKGKKVHTYCAGLLLLCALQTDCGREEFFPVPEHAPPGRTAANMAQLGLSLGEHFISPTGALFSPRLEIAGRREPMYDPQREVEEAVYDHFAYTMRTRQLNASPNLYQSLRLKMAQAAKQNPLLAQAMAKAAGVNAQTDLVSAAKAAAVVETLDEIAYGNSGEFLKAQQALRAGPLRQLERGGATPDQLNAVKRYRQTHARLSQLWDQGQLSPRALRIELVKYYIDQGKQQLDQRFFAPAKSPAAPKPAK